MWSIYCRTSVLFSLPCVLLLLLETESYRIHRSLPSCFQTLKKHNLSDEVFPFCFRSIPVRGIHRPSLFYTQSPFLSEIRSPLARPHGSPSVCFPTLIKCLPIAKYGE
ncbi:hypothetical protein K474DRAFT_1016208 [Panus rudis PR-1116 ss-1]|nr:hypothetical protein K474DRAFT_1016208 [Panus rudis PR-1116 ss-1]